jgi:hypothetical protein
LVHIVQKAIHFYFKTYNMNNAPIQCLARMYENHDIVVQVSGVYKWKKWQMSPPVGTEMSKIILIRLSAARSVATEIILASQTAP